MTHIDEWLDSPSRIDSPSECYAAFVLEYARMPAWKKSAYHPWMKQFKLFCTFEGARFLCTGASRMGDVWLAADFNREYGYDKRVDVEQCDSWSASP